MAEEILAEIEAVQAVYGDDCLILDKFPPHLQVHTIPRTADVSSQQFVEAVIVMRAGPKYPVDPPHIELVQSKGLDEQRQKELVTRIQNKACQLSSCLMLIALCEEAVDWLSIMNHPDGDCPLCLFPLVLEDEDNFLPFMKLMSCFHCFHCECIIRWWNWLQEQNKASSSTSSKPVTLSARDMENQGVGESIGSCPVCRKMFHAKDFEHVLHLAGSHSSQPSSSATQAEEYKKLLQSDEENIRRQRFEATLKLQQENCGLIEPPKNLLVLPGVYLPQPTTSMAEPAQSQNGDDQTIRRNPRRPVYKASTSRHTSSSSRKQGVRNSRKQLQQWIKKGSD